MGPPFHHATPEDILGGRVTGADAWQAVEILEAKGADPHVVAEVGAPTLPSGWRWAVLAGLEEALALFEDRDLDADALPEGSVFYAEEPVVAIAGRYHEFALLQSPLLGMLAQPSGAATTAARLKLAADGRRLYPIGAMPVHPAVGAVIERAAFVGGCDAVATPRAAELTGAPAVAPAGHDLALILGESGAWMALGDASEPGAQVVVTVGTVDDEREGAVRAAEVLGDRLASVRLDVPASRRGELARIVREVRWELDARGYSRVRILVTGEVDEAAIRAAGRHADAFGIGEAVASAPAVRFSVDIVEIDGRPVSRRGNLSGRKTLWGCAECGNRGITPVRADPGGCPRCGGPLAGLLAPIRRWGRREGPAPEPASIRARAAREAAEAAKYS
ncbi:MAG: nicotinate phosphoribosyltransferase [Actinomycetota bacterium]